MGLFNIVILAVILAVGGGYDGGNVLKNDFGSKSFLIGLINIVKYEMTVAGGKTNDENYERMIYVHY